jgi:hypothetical protein
MSALMESTSPKSILEQFDCPSEWSKTDARDLRRAADILDMIPVVDEINRLLIGTGEQFAVVRTLGGKMMIQGCDSDRPIPAIVGGWMLDLAEAKSLRNTLRNLGGIAGLTRYSGTK